MGRDTRPPKYVPAPPPKLIANPTIFRCQSCGKFKPVEMIQPGEPPEWRRCKLCWQNSNQRHEYQNPMQGADVENSSRILGAPDAKEHDGEAEVT